LAFTALLDANVLYPVYLCSALLRLAQAQIYQVRWSEQILQEALRSLKARYPPEEHASLERRFDAMERHFPEAMVTGYENLIPVMTNHEGDRHVLAAAIRGRADVIVTSNVRHFPLASRESYDIDVQGPDNFLCHQYDVRDPEYLMGILEHWASHLQNPPLSVEELVGERLARSAPKFSVKVLNHIQSREVDL
jgi:predicted nucleic acid-binding protein